MYPVMLLPFTLCIPLDLSLDVHYISNYASLTIYPMHSTILFLRCTLCIQLCFCYHLPYAFHYFLPPMYTMFQSCFSYHLPCVFRPISRWTLYHLPYAFHYSFPPMCIMYPIMLLRPFILCILSELSSDLHSSRMWCCVSW
jgi:hypothetical protein